MRRLQSHRGADRKGSHGCHARSLNAFFFCRERKRLDHRYNLSCASNNSKDGRLSAKAPVACGSADGARRTAERLSLSHIGVVAFTIRSDSETGDYDDQPTIFYRAGQLPAEFDLMP